MNSLVLSAFLIAMTGTAMASPVCSAPKAQWQPEATFQERS